MEEIKKKVSGEGLYLNRVPKRTRTEFIKLADEEFEKDWGMTLKWLVDFRSGLLSDPNQILMEQMATMATELAQLRSTPVEEKKEKKVIRSVSGRVIAERGD